MDGDSLAPPCGSDPWLLPHLFSALNLRADDVLYDLGCGDGRICLAACGAGVSSASTPAGSASPDPLPLCGVFRAVGVELESDVCDVFEADIERAGLRGRVSCVRGDLRDVDISDATVVVLYLLPEGVAAVQDKVVALMTAKEGVRVLCISWGLKGVKESKRVDVDGVTFYIYRSAEKHRHDSSPSAKKSDETDD